MSFWRWLLRLIGLERSAVPSLPPPPKSRGKADNALQAEVRGIVEGFMTDQVDFTSTGVSTRVKSPANREAAEAFVHLMFERGDMAAFGYSRIAVPLATRSEWLYQPLSKPLTAPPAPHFATTPSAPPTFSPSGVAPGYGQKKKRPPVKDPLDTAGTLTLSPEALRERALTITPWRTAWFGRVDVIPPQSDERTALVDRGLVLRGLLTEKEIAEIHRIGDLWLKHNDRDRFKQARASKTANEAVEALRRQKAEERAKKKAAAEARRKARQEEIERRRETEIDFLGRGVSGQLHDRRANVEKLEAAGLPVLATAADVASALGITVPRLRFLAFHQEAAKTTHYTQFQVPKRSGGVRLLSSPKPELARAQAWIREAILEKLPTHEAAHGFVKGRSTVTNARPHLGRDLVIQVDLEDFFPSITFPRVRGVFRSLGYSPAAATILALLTTETPRRELRYDDSAYQVAVGDRALPQGACTSPAISNLVVRRLDRRLTGLANKHGLTYTRYADDLTLSCPEGKRGDLAQTLARVRHVITEEGFRVQWKKGRVQRKGGRQLVTGLVVNSDDQPRVPRAELRRLRAVLHNAKKTGLEAQNRDGHPRFVEHLRGKIAYVSMVDAAQGARLAEDLEAALTR